MDFQPIKITQRGRSYDVEPDGILHLPGVAVHELKTGDAKNAPTKLDEGNLSISRKSLNFAGITETIDIPLRDIVRVQPYDTAIDIYKQGRKQPYKFVWGEHIRMELAGVPGDDGKIKPLAGQIIAQFIINERNRLINLLKSK